MTLITCSGPAGLTLAAPEGVTVDQVARTITGLAVPFGKPGRTGMGVLSFAAGSLRWTDPKRVKLLHEHDQRVDVIGYATDLTETPAGVMATFHVPEGFPAGDAALASAAAGLRDGLSVGVEPDDAVVEKLRRQAGRPGVVAGTGQLREVSLVSVPAFDDARISSVAAAGGPLVVSAWADASPTEEGTPMLRCATCGQLHALGLDCPTTPELATAASGSNTGKPADKPTDDKAGQADDKAGDQVVDTSGEGVPAPSDKPAIVRAAAGAATAVVTSEPSIYGFGAPEYGNTSRSFVIDAARVAFDGDPDARERFNRFNAQLAAGNPASVMALAAVAKTTDVSGQAADAYIVQGYRPDLLVKAIDAGRPIISRLSTTPISNSTPFAIPTEGEFSDGASGEGIKDHTEGTAHATEGTLGLGDDVMTPKPVSGAYRLSRELVDASNPAVDGIATRAMLRSYRRMSEDKVIAAIVAADASVTLSIDGVMALQGELVDFVDDDGQGADFVAMSRSFAKAMSTDVDADGRPFLNRYGQSVNAPGKAGGSGYEVEGAELVRAFRMATDTAALVRADGILWAESRVQQFRFEQAEGPGIIKLALWAYCGAKVLPTPSGGLPNVSRVTIAAA